MEQTDFHSLNLLAAALERYLEEAKVRDLFLIAPPKALGQLRQALSAKMRKLICGELARDYCGIPVHEMERQLGKPYEQALEPSGI